MNIHNILKEYNLFLRKDLAQNFLINNKLKEKIVKEGLEISNKDIILEIGSGVGNLTEELLPAKTIYAIELDKRFIKVLYDRFKSYENIKIINIDILKFDFDRLYRVYQDAKIIGNIPYYLSSELLFSLLKVPFKLIVLTLQYEFAKRLLAKPKTKEYCPLTLFANYYKTPQIFCIIKKHNFFPQPKVDSVVVKFFPKIKQINKPEVEALLFKLIKTAFSQRRRQIINSLRIIFPNIQTLLEKINIPKTKRAEELTLQDYINLAEKIFSLKN
jgi:16S rRNA (adenine1518-N6/adenine1519-N6)-dimethyltransferase